MGAEMVLGAHAKIGHTGSEETCFSVHLVNTGTAKKPEVQEGK